MPTGGPSQPETIPVEDAVGHVLAHDITEIRPGEFKGPAFRKGHVIGEGDLERLKRLGKQRVYVLRLGPGEVHEDDAALRLAQALAGPGVIMDSRPSEGKIALRAGREGLLKVDVPALTRLSHDPRICCASRHTDTLVEAGTIIAATRVIPLVIDETTLASAERIASEAGGIFSVRTLARPGVGVVVTGSETHGGLVQDAFVPVLRRKLRSFGCRITATAFEPDDRERIAGRIREQVGTGCGLILVTGGMSVDPDDLTRAAIADAGATDIVYGTPVLPGAMFLAARIGQVPVLGLPACVMFHDVTVFDLMLPRVLAGDRITREDLAALAHGGLCLDCETCRFPVCPFGK